MRGGLVQPDGSIAWTFVSHARFDGLGGFVDLLRRTTARRTCRSRSPRPRPSLWQRIAALAGSARSPARRRGLETPGPACRPGEVK